MKSLIPVMMTKCRSNTISNQISKSLHIQAYKLSNGLTVWLNEDHSQPKVLGAVLVKAGAKDSPNTGIAHYFEHMMFKGTDKIGTINYEKEKVLLNAIALKYDELAKTEDPKLRDTIQKEINELSIKAADYVIPNEFDRLISKYGGTKLNAGTSYDYTVYFNTFSPKYMEQWAEINSERLINPVFRLFQSELETVYEEKNMYNDFVGSQAVEKLTERYFHPHPYAYPIIGSTENLKNPRLSEMEKFFDTYYVASNMGLILSGDFHTETVLPILEKTFSRIRDGKLPEKKIVELPPFKGRETIQINVPIPFVKVMVIGFRGVPANHKDQVALNIALALLNNSNGTGYLDKLTVNHKVQASMALNESMNEAGILGVLVVPKLVFQSYAAAEELVWKEINRIKEGNFSEEVFQSLKLEQRRQYESGLENISSRAQMMMRVFSQGMDWNDYIDDISRIESLTKEDIIQVAQNYFTENYLLATKKTGKYPKDDLPKPNFEPIAPKNTDIQSEYAQQLESIPVKRIQPLFLDFHKDVETKQLQPLVTLYKTENPVNDIFTCTISYGIGTLEKPILSQLASYLSLLGTDDMTFEVFRNELQILGSSLSFEVSDTDFCIKVIGLDNHLDETMKLVGHFMKHVKDDNKKLHPIVDDAKVMEKALFKSSENIAMTLLEKIKFGDKSRFLTKLSLSDIKKLKGKDLIKAFTHLCKVECELYYCGNLPIEEVGDIMAKYIPLNQVKTISNAPLYRELKEYDKPTIYFYNMSDVSQSIVYGYVKGDVLPDEQSHYTSKLFTGYFGGDMSSLMFQEIREFRSYAYRVSGRYNQPPVKLANKPGDFVTMFSTQSDKTLDALTVLDSLIKDMPLHPERVAAVKQTILNTVNNEYPSFRKLSSKIARFRRDGYDNDPNKSYLKNVSKLEMDDISEFYLNNIKDRPIVYAIVGNSKKINMNKLAEFGTIVKVSKKDIYK